MKIIVTVDKNWLIGKGNGRLISIPADIKRLRQETIGRVVVCGRKTYENLAAMGVSSTDTMVLTSKEEVRGAETINSIPALLERLSACNPEEICVVGGERVFRDLLPYCDTVLVTKIDYGYEGDRYFENLDENPEWQLVYESEEQTYFDLEYYFMEYKKKEA